MSKAIEIHSFGGPEVLQLVDRDVPAPAPGEVKIRTHAIGLNFIEIYHRTGLYPQPLPFVPGQESAGEIIAVGEGVRDFAVGDRVACYSVSGAYAQERILPAHRLIPIPDDIAYDVAAAIMLKGLTACYLLEMTHCVQKGETILFHAAAGGVGQIAVQWAKSLGATVIGTVGSDEKAERARALGCDHVIVTGQDGFANRVRDITKGAGVDVVYDSIGKNTFEESLDCLRPRGLMVSFGNSSGPVAVPNLGILASKGSLYLTRPTTAHYFSDRAVELESARKLFEKVRQGVVKINIGAHYPLAEIAAAQNALAARQTTGSTIILP